jgi:hypothetical protein
LLSDYQIYQKKWRADNKEKMLAYHADYRNKNKKWIRQKTVTRELTNKKLIKQIQLEMGCAHCGYNENAVAMDFHHLSRKDKSFAIGTCIHYPFITLLREIDKCIILCSNCHRVEEEKLRIERGENAS